MIYRMYCVPRSGTTLLLKLLHAHPDITAHGPGFEPWTGVPEDDQVRVLKVDRHPPSGKGFVLIRNPLDVYASLLKYDKANRNWDIQERLETWCKALRVSTDGSPIDLFCRFWTARYEALFPLDMPHVSYEWLCTWPVLSLALITHEVGVPMNQAAACAHVAYEPGQIIHADNEGNRAVDTKSLGRGAALDRMTTERIVEECGPTARKYGYRIGGEHGK